MKLELKKIYKFNSLLDFFEEMYSGNILDFIRDLANDPEGRLSENLAEYFED